MTNSVLTRSPLRALPYFEETGKFSLAMPNAANMAFHFPTVLKSLLICAFMPGTLGRCGV